MPDITMCLSKECPLRKECYRSLAKPNIYRQSYADFFVAGEDCADFWLWRPESDDNKEDINDALQSMRKGN